MTTPWSDLLTKITQQASSGPGDEGAVWRDFEALATTSPRAAELTLARDLGARLPEDARTVLAGIVAILLDPIDWPPAWERARGPLVDAIAVLLRELDPARPATLAALLDLGKDPPYMTSRTTLFIAHALLERPCPQVEIQLVGHLCRLGNLGCHVSLQEKMRAVPPPPAAGPIADARARYDAALQTYANAARSLNTACGAVMFDGIDLRLTRG